LSGLNLTDYKQIKEPFFFKTLYIFMVYIKRNKTKITGLKL